MSLKDIGKAAYSGSVPVWRFYLIIVIVSVVVGTMTYFMGKAGGDKSCQLDHAESALEGSLKDTDILIDIYSNLPQTREEMIEWLKR